MGKPNAVMGAMLACPFGLAPTSLLAQRPTVLVGGVPAAVITDIAVTNIPGFGMCNSLANPTVAAATAAALGTLTPMPCVPVVVSPWAPPAAQTLIGSIPALTAGATCQCAYGGTIMITFPGQATTLSA